MSALAFYLEQAGIATTGISLVRENTVALRPPRFLWVPFPLGRPLGAPGDAAFQHDVITAALALFDRPAGPVLEDFPLDAPMSGTEHGWACPVSFPAAPANATPLDRLLAELTALQPWYELSRARRGRTTVGLAPGSIADLARQLLAAIDNPPTDIATLRALGLAIEDLKAWCLEAATARTASAPAAALADWLWQHTEVGRAIRALADRCARSGSPLLQAWVRGLLPRAARSCPG